MAMPMTNFTSPRTKLRRSFPVPILNTGRLSATSRSSFGSVFLAIQGLSYPRIAHENTNLDLIVRSSVEPGIPLPPDPSPGSWKSWLLGAVITIVLPFLRHKWGPLFKLTKEVETVVETADHVTEVIEKVAEEVEKVADEVADDLPEGTKLKEAMEFIEEKAKETAKKAHWAEELIDKVEEVEKEVESFVEPVKDEENRTGQEASGQK
ncbi:hypothetical protein NMG60_11016753 [Bertholletia excelsa]